MSKRGASILVVDDEREIVRALRRSLSAHGFTVLTASSGEEAVRVVSQQRPDLLLLDLLLPGVSGLEVCRQVRAVSNVPIIVLSVKDAERDKVEALDLGADDYVAKPFGMKEVLARVRVALRRVAQPPAWGQKFFLDGKLSGGALLDLHIHDTDFIQFCFGRPLSVFSTGFSKVSGAIDHVVTQYQVASGACVSAEGSWAMTEGFGFQMSYTAVFENATADYDIARGADALKLFEKGKEPRALGLSGQDGYLGELKYMLECVRSGTPPSTVTPQDGVSAVEICEAEERSVNSGKIVGL